MISKEDLARFMHEQYEAASIEEGWGTQEKCRVDFDDLPEDNKRVMLRVAEAVLQMLLD